MPLTPGSRLGPYEILAPIGAGGMGEVYRARDSRLGREVAIKVLPQHLSADPARRERFEREARAVSALNHPHICVLHDIGSQDTPQGAIDFLVMEHIEGETLADRVAKGPLPVEQVLRYAMEIADALDKAHRQGIVHRDLKPQNVMLTKSGAKLLDFGLAKLRDSGAEVAGAPAAAPGTPGSGGSLLPTATRNLTTAGTLLGTFQYMAPEQLEGREADARTDIFTFGVLVYEMATGRRAFEGRSQASLIAAILKEQPRPIADLQPLYPTGLDRVVRACMAKDPDDRVQTARDVRMQLEWVADGSLSGVTGALLGRSGVAMPSGVASQSGVAPMGGATGGQPAVAAPLTPRRGAPTWVAVSAALLFGAVTAGIGWWLRPPLPRPLLRVNLQLPPKTQLDNQNSSLALSPDGQTLAYTGAAEDGKPRLFIRALDSLQAQALAGTENATYPFWSPDGRFIGFFADGKLKKIQAAGGTVQTLCEAADGRGATWSIAGTIAFAPGPYGGLQLVSAAGGTPATLTTPESEGTTHRLPHYLPDGKHLLFLKSQPGKDGTEGIFALDIDTKKTTQVAAEKSEGRFVTPDHLVFFRDGNLLAQHFDTRSLQVSGEAVPIAEKVQFNPNRWTGEFTFSDNGLFLYLGGAGVRKGRLTWIDLEGKEQGAVGEAAHFIELRLAPDQHRAIATLWAGSGVPDLWLYDLARGIGSRFTFAPEGANGPIWSPDGRQVAYTDSQNRIFAKATDGASEPRSLLGEAGTNRTLTDWTRDGTGIIFWAQQPKTGLDIFLLPMGGDGKPKPILASPANEQDGTLHPGGHWLLYNSDESGRREEYVMAYPGPGGKFQVSPAGAGTGGWVDGGKGIIYVDLDGKVMRVDVTIQGGSVIVGAPHPVFGGHVWGAAGDVTSDGRRALVAQPTEEISQSSLILVTDWTAALQKP